MVCDCFPKRSTTLFHDDLLSVALYYLSAAGTGLGSYQFLQDSSLLPSNIAAVAMLWGIWLWVIGKPKCSGVCFGVAGIFRLASVQPRQHPAPVLRGKLFYSG